MEIHIFLFIVGCPCDGYESCWACEEEIAESCQDPEQNENFIGCRQIANDNFVLCANNCNGLECYENCLNQQETDLDNCPCGVNCKSR